MTTPTAQPTSQAGWHYAQTSAQGSQPVGSFTSDQIIEMVRAGTLKHGTLVWKEGMAQWTTIGQVPEFASQMAAPPVQPGLIGNNQYDSERRIGDDLGIRMLIPVGRSGWAIAAGYLGLFSVLLFPAPFAVLTGCIAIWDIRTHEHRHGMGRAIFGIIAGCIGTLYLVVTLANGAFLL